MEMSEMGGLAKQTPLLACFFVAASLATIGLPGFRQFLGRVWGFPFAWASKQVRRFFLYLAALGIIISAVFGLRAVARIFFGRSQRRIGWSVLSQKKIRDSQSSQRWIPAGLLILIALLLDWAMAPDDFSQNRCWRSKVGTEAWRVKVAGSDLPGHPAAQLPDEKKAVQPRPFN